MAGNADSTTTAAPWHAAYPSPINTAPGGMTRDEVLEMMKKSDGVPHKEYLLVDLRRADHEGGTIRGSVNLPAQSLYPSIPTLYQMFKAAGIRKAIWYCSSSRGRGTRAAGWFADYIAKCGDEEMQSLILVEGIKGWATAGGEFADWMDAYDAAFWTGKKEQ
ncbi:hypothetical protein AAE478_008946 [Parahypoxylon ruwenzoriense]